VTNQSEEMWGAILHDKKSLGRRWGFFRQKGRDSRWGHKKRSSFKSWSRLSAEGESTPRSTFPISWEQSEKRQKGVFLSGWFGWQQAGGQKVLRGGSHALLRGWARHCRTSHKTPQSGNRKFHQWKRKRERATEVPRKKIDGETNAVAFLQWGGRVPQQFEPGTGKKVTGKVKQ